MTITLLPVTSSNVEAVGYDRATQTLRIVYIRGGTWDYAGVEPGVYERLLRAPSKGKFIAQSVKPAYLAKRVDAPKLDYGDTT